MGKLSVFKKLQMWNVLIFCLLCFTLPVSVSAENQQKYTVKFNNNAGTNAEGYSSMNCVIQQGKYIRLPQIPAIRGYHNLGWTTVKKGTEAQYKEGQKVKVTKNMKFYAVRRRIYHNVAFYNSDGTSNAVFAGLQKSIASGKKIKLPPVPAKNGYQGIGWTTVKGSTSVTHKAKSTCVIQKKQKFYAVYKRNVDVVLHKNDGTVLKTYTVGKGGSLKLPGTRYKTSYTMLGWSKKKKQTENPDYEVGETLKNIKKTIHLYEVVFQYKNETNLSASKLRTVNKQKYSHVVFVGDSRTARMKNTLYPTRKKQTKNIHYVAKRGEGLEWFSKTGYKRLLKVLNNIQADSGATAVVFNLGINDLENIDAYIACMKKISPVLKSRGCRLYYMSVNPVCRTVKRMPRSEQAIRKFNLKIQKKLCSGADPEFIYMDTYSYLMDKGFSTVDGLHFTDRSTKRIYNYCMKIINS